MTRQRLTKTNRRRLWFVGDPVQRARFERVQEARIQAGEPQIPLARSWRAGEALVYDRATARREEGRDDRRAHGEGVQRSAYLAAIRRRRAKAKRALAMRTAQRLRAKGKR